MKNKNKILKALNLEQREKENIAQNHYLKNRNGWLAGRLAGETSRDRRRQHWPLPLARVLHRLAAAARPTAPVVVLLHVRGCGSSSNNGSQTSRFR